MLLDGFCRIVEEQKFHPQLDSPCAVAIKVGFIDAPVVAGLNLPEKKIPNGLAAKSGAHLIVFDKIVRLGLSIGSRV